MAKLAVIKTKETTSSVEDFINTVPDEQKRKDSFTLVKLMQKATKEKPKLWGTAIIGFGNKRFQSPTSGREVDWFKVGFSPRKASLSLYLPPFLDVKVRSALLKKLGKHKTDGGCIYINKLQDVDAKVLEELITAGVNTK
jgi:hypothetical protein